MREGCCSPSTCRGPQGTPYAVFGLGNKTYEHYNAMGKHIHKHLATLGGASIVPLGLGDDDADIADDFEVWVDTLIKAIDAKALLHQSSAARTGATQAKVGYTVELHDAANGVATNGKSAATNGKARANDAVQNGKHDIQPEPWVAGAEKHVPVLATVAAVRELHSSGSERSCVHAEVSLTGARHSAQRHDGTVRSVSAAVAGRTTRAERSNIASGCATSFARSALAVRAAGCTAAPPSLTAPRLTCTAAVQARA